MQPQAINTTQIACFLAKKELISIFMQIIVRQTAIKCAPFQRRLHRGMPLYAHAALWLVEMPLPFNELSYKLSSSSHMTTQSLNTSTYNNPLNDVHFIFLLPPPPHLCSYTQLNYWCEVIISFISGKKHLF